MEGLQLRYFVLKPESSDDAHAEASRAAILAYAACIQSSNPLYATSLRNWVSLCVLQDIQRKNQS
jgi:hypothetical protein